MSRGRSSWWRGRLLLVGGLAAGLGAFAFACGGEDGGAPAACEGASCEDGGPEGSTPIEGGSDTSTTDSGSDGGLDAGDASDTGTTCTGPAGTLDPTFGDGGIVWLTYPGSAAYALALQADGKSVVGGGTSGAAALVRLQPNGDLDTTFGAFGLVETQPGTLNNRFFAVVVQPDGRIVAAGSSRVSGTPSSLTVMRFLADGSPDATFGNAGTVLTAYPGRDAYAHSVVLLPGGKILVAGFSEDALNPTATANFEVVRYESNGGPDATFGSGGKVTVDVRGTDDREGVISLAPGGKVVLTGSTKETVALTGRYDVAVVRLDPDGAIDTTFATAGKFISSFGSGTQRASDVAVDATGRIYIGGWLGGSNPDDFAALRLTASGLLDGAYGDAGVARLDFSGRVDRSAALVLQEDGRAILAGASGVGAQSDSYGIAAARLLPTGTPDLAFGTGGTVLSLPPANSQTGAGAAALSACTVTMVGSWTYDLNTMARNAMGIARYRR